jgi:predicted metalloendopeptidase
MWAPRLDETYNRPFHYFRNITGDEFSMPPTERGKVCLGEVQDSLDWLLGSVFIDRVFSPQAKALGDDIVKSIINVYTTRLEALDWMTNSTKVTAKKKRMRNLVVLFT